MRMLVSVACTFALCVVSLAAQQVDPDDMLTLAPSVRGGFSEGCKDISSSYIDQIIERNATRSPFVIPSGKVFVMTGATWMNADGPVNSDLEIRLRNMTTGSNELAAIIPSHTPSDFLITGGLMLTPGVVVQNGTAICVLVRTGNLSWSPPREVRIYGYVAKTNKFPRAQAVVSGQ